MRFIIHCTIVFFAAFSLAACSEAVGTKDTANTIETQAIEVEASIPDEALSIAIKGTNWVLESIDGAKPVHGTQVTLTMDENGSLYGSAGCNRFNGRYELNGDDLKIHPAIASTMMACAEDAMTQEHQFHQILAAAERAVIVDEVILELNTAENKKLRFTAE